MSMLLPLLEKFLRSPVFATNQGGFEVIVN